MAKLPNLWLKGGSQKLGGVVLYQSNGQTLARELAASVSNPRTDAQMEQRVKLANVVGVYRANRNWMTGAFEDKKQNESDYNAFVRANLANSLVATSKSQAAAGAAVVAPYKVSSGSLPVVEHVVDGTELQTNLYVGELVINQATSVAELSQALINNNNGIREGMQLSLIINIQQQAQETGIPYIVVRAYEMIISLSDSRLVSEFFPSVVLVATTADNPALAMGISFLGAGAACFILSETLGGKTRVSTQSLVAFGSNQSYAAYTSQEAWSEAIRSYGVNTTVFLDSNTAQGGSYVPTSNYIDSLSYASRLYRQNSTIEGGISTATKIFLYLAAPLTGTALPDVVIKNKNTSQEISVSNLEVQSGRALIDFYAASNIAPSGVVPFEIIVTGETEVMTFNINISGDIS